MLEWTVGKKEHRELSDAAAHVYDELYEQSNFATGSYMRYEVELIERFSGAAPAHDVAVDLGCGTGRDSFVLARRFDQVYAYDFSEAMIDVSNRNKLMRRSGNVLFGVRDVEEQGADLPAGSAAFVNSAFGMGSFVADVGRLLREAKRLLRPGGVALFSFYNSKALVNQLDLPWQPALAARAVAERDVLNVSFDHRSFAIASRSYTVHDIRHKLEDHGLEILSLTTFPSLSSLLPQELFEQERARELCTSVDHVLAENLELAAGPYIAAVVRRPGRPSRSKPALGYMRVLELLDLHKVEKVLRHHAPVQNMADVGQVLEAQPAQMAKSILVALKAPSGKDRRGKHLYLVVVPADRKVEIGKLATLLGVKSSHVELATQVDVEELTGFTIGSIPPFGLPKNVPVIFDKRLLAFESVWCGTGRATESMYISVRDLRRLSAFSVGDVATEVSG